jgi:hypothetical protein
MLFLITHIVSGKCGQEIQEKYDLQHFEKILQFTEPLNLETTLIFNRMECGFRLTTLYCQF